MFEFNFKFIKSGNYFSKLDLNINKEYMGNLYAGRYEIKPDSRAHGWWLTKLTGENSGTVYHHNLGWAFTTRQNNRRFLDVNLPSLKQKIINILENDWGELIEQSHIKFKGEK